MDDPLFTFGLTVIAGIVGGLVAHLLAWRLFRMQTIFQTGLHDTIKRRDAFRDALALSHEINRGLAYGWKRLSEEDEDTAKRLEDWRAQLNSAASLFASDDDATKGLFGLRNMIGIDQARFQKSGIDPSLDFRDVKERLGEALARIENQLSE